MSRRAWLLSNAARTVPAVAAAAATAFSLTTPNSAHATVDDATTTTTKSTAPTTTTTTTTTSSSSSSSSSTKWTLFEDPKHGFSLQIPSDWTFTQQTLRDRRTLYLWTDPNPSTTTTTTTTSALFIAYTPIRDDFTSLNSFGTVDQVAAQTILPKTELLLGGDNSIRATMVEAKAQQSAYYFDYKQSVPAMSTTTILPEMHYRTIFTLSSQAANGGAGSVLVTITAQTSEEQYQNAAVRNVFDTIIDSFRKI